MGNKYTGAVTKRPCAVVVRDYATDRPAAINKRYTEADRMSFRKNLYTYLPVSMN